MELYVNLFQVTLILFSFHHSKSDMDEMDVYTLLSGRINMTNLALSEMETKLLDVQLELDQLKQNVYDDNACASLNTTLTMEEIKDLKNENSNLWTLLKQMMAIVVANEQTDVNLYHELSLIRSDITALRNQQTIINNTMLDHLAVYIQQIDTAVENIERCQTGTVGLHDYPIAPIPGSKKVTFVRPFLQTPTMAWGVVTADLKKDYNTRYYITLNDITKTGFTFNAGTWGGTVVYGLKVRWIACPA